MLDPTTQQALLPSAETWWDRYGAIGVVAFLALLALALSFRQFLAERREDRERARREAERTQADQAALEKRNNDLSDRIVEVVAANHHETQRLLSEQAERHEARYQALLEKYMTEQRHSAEAMRAQNTAVVDALNAVVKKSRST